MRLIFIINEKCKTCEKLKKTNKISQINFTYLPPKETWDIFISGGMIKDQSDA